MIKLEMKNHNMICRKKLKKQQKYQHYHLIKIDKYEYLTAEETLPPDRTQIKEQAKFKCSPLGKDLKKLSEK